MCVFSCGSAGRPGTGNTTVDQVKVKQEPGVEEECSYSGANVKTERCKDGRRSACMVFTIFSLQFLSNMSNKSPFLAPKRYSVFRVIQCLSFVLLLCPQTR